MTLSGSTAAGSINAPALALNVYPNPASGNFTVEIPECINLPYLMSICSVSGITVKIMEVTSRSTSVEQKGDVKLRPGTYIVKCGNGHKTAFTKLVIR